MKPAARKLILNSLMILFTLLLLTFGAAGITPAQAQPLAAIPVLGTYSNTTVVQGGNITVTPSAAPTNTTSINVSTSTNFKGSFTANPTSGVVRIINAHLAGTYTVTVKAFGPGGSTSTTFALTVTNGTLCTATPAFSGTTEIGVGYMNQSIALGDFNNDGNQDVATANLSSGTVSIRLGDGMGGFSGSTEIDVEGSPESLAFGDFNNDGNQDLAAAIGDIGGKTVSIHLGDGTGGFSGSTKINVGTEPESIALGDFNNDGNQDFVAANRYSDAVSIRLGDGTGNFSGSVEVGVGSQPHSVALGDFNNDGKQDFATANYNYNSSTVSIRLGDGAGNFSGTTNISVGSGPWSVALGDFNNDGNQDFATANTVSNTISIRLGDGTGNFSGTTDVSVGSSPFSVAVGDFNNDGKQDFAAANDGSNSVSIRLGDGAGNFSDAADVSVGRAPWAVVVGDFNNDGKQDFATSNLTSRTVSIRLGNLPLCYDGNTHTGGAAPMDASSPYAPASTVTVLNAGTLVKSGYTFNGWNTAANGSGTSYAPAATFPITAPITLYAQWTPDAYTLTVISAHGTVTKTPNKATYQYGDVVTLSVTPDAGWSFKDWTPSLTNNQVTISGNTTVTANYRQIPVITWTNPADINFGTALSATQLNATASVPGTFTYTPSVGSYLAVGSHTLHVDFTPTDPLAYSNASRDVSINILEHTLYGDVPPTYWAKTFIDALFLAQITAGCGGGNFCPDMNITRDQMAVFVLRAKYGASYTPPAVGASTGFSDVPTNHWAAAWIKQMVAEGISGGCGANRFCPTQSVTRAQAAVMLLVAEHGAGYTPPASKGLFKDVPANNWAAPWVEQLAAEGIASGCGGGKFCPNTYVTRAQMAVFLVTTFNLP